MDVRIEPGALRGTVKVPPSKSAAHRLLIAAALTRGTSVIEDIYPSVDILTTAEALRQLGARIDIQGSAARVTGIETPPAQATIDCCESGSALRFLIPVAAALGTTTTFLGQGNLPNRPIGPYLEELPSHGITFDYQGTMPFTIRGKLRGGEFSVDGGISSQFITGLLLAFPAIGEPCTIKLTSRLESRPYVDMTLGALRYFGFEASQTTEGYEAPGPQTLRPWQGAVEGDYSQAAFFKVANALGSRVEMTGLTPDSMQGDKLIMTVCQDTPQPMDLDCSDVPDLVPILTVLAAFAEGTTCLNNVGRLRIKECDRLAAMEEVINALGGSVTAEPETLVISGKGSLRGGEVSSHNDHRIAMAAAIAATACKEPVTIRDAQCVAKSFPDFWEVFEALGGRLTRL